MYIEEVIIDGFKSYSTRTVVGKFDPQFTAITGLNGSGKSNILDSICFVLGITNLQQVRVHNLQELVYKQGQAGITKASVSIVFNNENRDCSPHGYAEHKKITVTRQIVIGGKNKYMINSHLVQAHQVATLFHSVGLNVNNPHFLIMQGRITKVINMKPPEILGMIEEAAGTRMYESKKEQSIKLMVKKQAKVDEIHRILQEDITPTLEKLGQERANYLRWSSLNNEVLRLDRWVKACDYVTYQAEVSAGEEKRVAVAQSQTDLTEQVAATAQLIAQIEARLGELVKSREDASSNKLAKLEKKKDVADKEKAKWESKTKHATESLAEEKKRITETDADIAKALKAQEKKQKELDGAEKVRNEAEAKKVQCAQLVDNLEATLAALQSGADAAGQASLQEQLMAAQAEVTKVEGDSKRLLIELKTARTALAPAEKELSKCEKEGKEVTAALKQKETELQKATAALDKLAFDARKFGEVEVKARQEKQRVQECQDAVNELEEKLARVNFTYNPIPKFDDSKVKGVVARLFEVKETFRSYSTAVEVCAGGRLFHVVVDTEETAKVLLKQQLRRRVTIIPLNKINNNTCEPARVKKAKELALPHGEVHHAMEILGHENQVKAAMQFVFGGALVCDSPETAKLVTFHPQVRVRSVTKQGDVYDPAGTVEGGSAPKTGDILGRLAELRRRTEELDKRKANWNKVSDTWAVQCKQRDEHERLTQEVKMKEHDLKITQERVKNTEHGAKFAYVQEKRAEVAQIEKDLGSIDDRRKSSKAKVTELEKSVLNFQDEKASRGKKLEKQIADNRKEAKAAEATLQKLEEQRMTLATEMDACKEDVKSGEETKAKILAEVATFEKDLTEASTAVATAKSELAEIELEMKKAKELVQKSDKEHKEATMELKKQEKVKDDAELELKKVTIQLTRFDEEQQTAKNAVATLERECPWILQERAFFNKPGTDYDFQANDYDTTKARLAEMKEEHKVLEKSVNKKVVGMFEKAEEEHADLIKKKDIIIADKAKIEKVIMDLDQKKKEAIEKTHSKVSDDFGKIFSTLLPNVSAKLEIPEGMTCNDGLEIKVAFHGVWKQSLTELSGGQKSLLALSLVLALLLFKPAPMYILDEIDAALDLSHTQNIGAMIRQHFPHSQFIVVSLKEGMFTNASVLFKTRFVDGTSAVERRTLRDKEDAEKAKQAPAAVEDAVAAKLADQGEPPRKRKKGVNA